MVWQIEEGTWASTVRNKIYNFFILAQIKSSSQDQKQKIILLHYKWGFFKRLIGFKRHDQFLRIFFSNIHRILFGIFSTQVAEPLRTYAIITLLRYIYPIIFFII